MNGIQHLTQLTRLDLWNDPNARGEILVYNNKLTDVTPLAALSNLTYLDLRTTGIANLNGLQNLTNLTDLLLGNISHMRPSPLAFSDISPLAALTNLKSLDLSVTTEDTYILDTPSRISDLSPLSNMPRLRTLKLVGLELTDASFDQLASYPNLANLTAITLGGYKTGNIPSNLNPIRKLTKLQDITLLNWSMTDLSPITSITGLTQLSITNLGTTRANTFEQLTPLSGLTSLTSLSIINEYDKDESTSADIQSPITDIRPLRNLTNLQSLTLDGHKISDISPLSGLTSLGFLNLGHNGPGNRISDITPLSNLNNLMELYLCNNQISDIHALSSIPRMRMLDLSNNLPNRMHSRPEFNPNLPHNQIVDISPLASNPSLTQLWASDNHIQDVTPLGSMNQIGLVWLENNQISDLSPIQHSSSIYGLFLAGNRLTDSQVGIIAQMPFASHQGGINQVSLGDDITDISPLIGTYIMSLTLQGSHLDADKLTSTISSLSTLSGLYTLRLRNNGFTNEQFRQIMGQTNFGPMSYFAVTGSHVTDITPVMDNAASLNRMNQMDLSGNEIQDITPLTKNLGALTSITNLDISNQNVRLPAKPDFDPNNPMRLGPATIDSTATPKRYAPIDPTKPSTPAGSSYDANTATVTWPATLPGDYAYSFNYEDRLPHGDFKFSGTIAQEVPGITVSFDPDGGSPRPADQYLHIGEKIGMPSGPHKPGFVLGGWTDSGTGSMWDFANDTVSANITLKAYWTTPMNLPSAGSIPLARLSGLTILLSSGGALALYTHIPRRSRGKHLSSKQ
ncbi:InlB B-repeat-containing protein [Bombiscardovia apis]|uniref:InlB B-repeat-containing protein n=1 Tax=Bombiscardovia apis TaxID=2932182 RepID=UPI002954A348|nr:InlB B-repeat-containing protein [Bombiscardovia apis]